ncbi:LysR family transcriptional regulator [Methylobacterium sp. 17Sr1-1]|uniref:LysR family transcriptional regulator n=1 Tax=Methylobacterium sp. 17Sr1-1 TaxID=2202826 RepID=UPI000D6FE110|nr:LysR family transcriptional regulator [Methylobacterium sp. 17Sr1-1]AWN54657.1 LysR family transcriptional regulator [Methylobacterium sp. 17Sr1-1]
MSDIVPDLRTIQIFYWTAALGSFSAAAKRLNTTQPAVSHRIAALERAFGLTLINRLPRSLSLTPKGHELMGYAERLLRLHGEMVGAITAPASRSGSLRLGVSETIVHTWLTAFIEVMGRTYPGVAIDLAVDVSPVMREALLRRDLDLAFLVGPVTTPKLVNVSLGQFATAWIASPGLVTASGPIGLAELTRHPIITFPPNTTPYAHLRDLLVQADLPPPRLYTSASLSAIIRMAIEGTGIGAMPADAVLPEIERGQLRVLDASVGLPAVGFVAAYENAPDNRLSAAAAEIARSVATEWFAMKRDHGLP